MRFRLKKQTGMLILSSLGIFFFSLILYKIYIPRISQFGCFDDCNNFMGGYFLLHGKKLFSEIFFNHAPGMAYISFAIQKITTPINLYELILRHRQFILLFGFIGNLFLFLRFRYKMLGVILTFELAKFYLFGDRFLAESVILYPTIYLAGIVWNTIIKKKIYLFDFIVSAILSWFIVFTREPYVPLTLFLFGTIIFFGKIIKKMKIIAIIIFSFLSFITLFYHNISEFIFNVYTVNISNIQYENESTQILGYGIFKAFLYPFYVLTTGETTTTRSILIILSLLFILETIIFVKLKKYRLVLFAWITLILANLRPSSPGSQFFASFHMLLWFGLLLFFSFSFLWEIKVKTKFFYILLTAFLTPILILLIPSNSYLYEKIDSHTIFITNYGGPFQVGNVIGALSTPKDTLFVDGFDDIIYWVSKKKSNYKYSWYTSLMPKYKKYTDARIDMFRKNPPDFYYGSCLPKNVIQKTSPLFIKNDYIRLNNFGKPSCLWIKKSKLSSVSEEQWIKAGEQLYTLPKGNANGELK